VKVPFIGAHGVQIALVALAVGYSFGMHVSEMILGLQDPSIQARLLFVPGPRGSHLIDDTYNASSPSVLSALGVLQEVPATRRIAVLGEMRELGDLSEQEHRLVGQRAGDVVDMLITFGDEARIMADEALAVARGNGHELIVHSYAEDEREAMTDFLAHELRQGDVVLLKGSRGLLMENIVAALRSDTNSAEPGDDTSSRATESNAVPEA